MSIEEIRQSGKLEYYVLGLLSEQESQQVQDWLVQFPDLKADIREIQLAMQQFAQEHGIAPRRSLEDEIVDSILQQNAKPPTNSEVGSGSSAFSLMKFLGWFLLGLISCLLLWYAYSNSKKATTLSDRLSTQEVECDSIQSALSAELELYREVSSPAFRKLPFIPTPAYQQTKIELYYNEQDGKNYLRIQELPAIAKGQAFQLWSLKDGVDPIPLTVFSDSNGLIPLDYEDGTGTYAITIEVAAGASSPTLERLIGTCGV